NDMWWATAKGGDRSDGLSFGSRGNFLGHHAARFRFHPSAASRQPEHPKCNNVLRFDDHLKNLHAPHEPRIEHFWFARQLGYARSGLRGAPVQMRSWRICSAISPNLCTTTSNALSPGSRTKPRVMS